MSVKSGSAKELLEKASLFLRRKIPQTGHLMCPRSLWLQTTPADSEVLVVFPANGEVPFVDWLLNEIKRQLPGLLVTVKHMSVPGASYGLYCSATYESLLQCAEKLHLVKPLLPEVGGGSKEFSFSDAENFLGVEDEGTFLSSQERQAIVLEMLNNVRFAPGHPAPLPQSALGMHEGQPIVPSCLAKGYVQDVLPVHEEFILTSLRRRWVQAFLAPQPLDMICSYFGVKIALYFAWLGYYTTALLLPGIAGLAYWCGFCNAGDQISEDAGFVLLSVINVVWATVFLEGWKRKEKELAYTWGTLDQRDELLTDPRPMYNGPIITSPVTGRPEPYFAPWKRLFISYFFSYPLIFLCLLLVLAVMWGILQVQDWWDDYIEKAFPYCTIASYIPKVALSLCVTFFEWLYKKVAVWLNDLENYRSEESYQNQLTVKLVLFQFVNSFVALFYVAFYLRDMEKLRDLLFTMLIIRQLIGNIKESALPYVVEQMRLAKLSFDLFGALSPTDDQQEEEVLAAFNVAAKAEHDACAADGSKNGSAEPELRRRGRTRQRSEGSYPTVRRTVSQAEVESQMPKYDGTFEDYSELFIQFGYVAFFSSAFPLASLWAFFNNVIEIRTDAFKLCYVLQRPFGERVRSIGTWQDAMEWMGVIAIMVNCALIGQSGQMQRIFPDLPPHGTFILIVVLEHLMLILRAVLRYCIPDIPTWIATEMARIEFSRRSASSSTRFTSTFGQGMNSKTLPRISSTSLLRSVRSQSLDRSPSPSYL